jgi:hypothetical protein
MKLKDKELKDMGKRGKREKDKTRQHEKPKPDAEG